MTLTLFSRQELLFRSWRCLQSSLVAQTMHSHLIEPHSHAAGRLDDVCRILEYWGLLDSGAASFHKTELIHILLTQISRSSDILEMRRLAMAAQRILHVNTGQL